MSLYRIIKTVRAENITDAVKKEKAAPVEVIELIEETSTGFRT